MSLYRNGTLFIYVFFLPRLCLADHQHISQIYPRFEASQLDWNDQGGLFLLSNKSVFGFGFFGTLDVSLFVLVVVHLKSYKVVWTANRGLLVRNSDKFVFDNTGNAYLERGGVVWATNTGGRKVRALELKDSGNLVIIDEEGRVIWESFDHPTDTLLPNQTFVEGMSLKSFPNSNNLFSYLTFMSGDLVLYAGYDPPQIYWSLSSESNNVRKGVHFHSACLISNSWNFYDKSGALKWKSVFADKSNPTAMIPQDPCGIAEPCDPYNVCFFEDWCECPALLKSRFNCKPPTNATSSCPRTREDLLYVGEKLDYFALKYVEPVSKSSSLSACKEGCLRNCSCLVLFFENSTGECYHFDQIGSFQRSKANSGYVSFMKISIEDGDGRKGRNLTVLTIVVVILTILIVIGLVLGFWYYYKNKHLLEDSPETLEEDDFLDSLHGMPTRFSYSTLSQATKNFSTKIGEGGFGSVYLGVLEDGSQLAVKKLEGLGQGAKEFKAEVSSIGSIHHVHLVNLKGFCAEGPHRLLVYEYMERGSLNKWIFRSHENAFLLNWNTRFNIALGTARGLAYLHEECEVKIIHCDIKPENVLLDENFTAKVSDFGLAKIMSREQSHVFTTLRGTRGYLAPEWITNYAISEKSDVYSYGMILLEIIGGRRNYDQWEGSEKVHFPSYAFRMMEEGKLKQVLDPMIDIEENDERAFAAAKVALWCIQDDMSLRPPMTKVVQMLEGVIPVPEPPSLSSSSSYSSFLKMSSEQASSSSQTSFYSNVPLSCVQLSGPR
ncbi:hypothetical protein K1719_043291 [Acacia pycnantha]|nr:hypothetical protein K1719_043291 [Acacia pycnantha]